MPLAIWLAHSSGFSHFRLRERPRDRRATLLEMDDGEGSLEEMQRRAQLSVDKDEAVGFRPKGKVQVTALGSNAEDDPEGHEGNRTPQEVVDELLAAGLITLEDIQD